VSEGEAAPAPVAGHSTRNLALRVAAALVLAPLAIAIAYAGGWLWTALVTLAAIGLYVEWLMMAAATREIRVVTSGVIVLAAAGLCLAAGRIESAFVVLPIGLVALAAAARERRGWIATGFIYAAAAQAASVLVRDSKNGFVALVFVLLVVWATDIGGYFAGRGIGGPKLWPRVSPKKTWAGALGGFVASLVVAAGFVAFDFGKAAWLLPMGAMLSIVSQLGDLFESAVKRRFGVKDSSHIIPGHGGLLDRLDGFVAAIVLAAILGFVRGGMDGVGHGLMVW
jgi:phosphatidate cytidylyltransferase